MFCGAVGKLTAEHVFGDWLSRIGLNTEPAHHAAGWLNRSPRNLGTTRPFKTTVRDVCGPCNNGWMSRLEAEASRVLTPLILGTSGSIAVTDHPAIAAWAHKTALVNMLVSSAGDRASGYGVPAKEYRDLYLVREQVIPAAMTQFWIGRYQGRYRASVWVTPIVVNIEGLAVAQSPQAYVIVIVLGELFLQGVRFTTPGLEVDLVSRDDLRKLWPTSGKSIKWPPAVPIDDTAMMAASKGFNLESAISAVKLGPWRVATDLPESTTEGPLVRLPTPCGEHFVYYPVVLALEALNGSFHSFTTACDCGKGYLVRTEHDGAHFKAEGEPSQIEAQYDALRGEELVFQDEAGEFVCKRLEGLD